MASLKEIMNVEDDPASHPHPLKRVLEPGPRPPHGPESSFPSSRSAFSSSATTPAAATSSSITHSHPALSLANNRSPPPAYPQTARVGASPSTSSTPVSLGSDPGNYRRPSNASADSMDSYYAHGYLPDRSAVSNSTAMRPNLPAPAGSENQPVKLTPVTGRVSKAKKGIPVHECDICQPPKNFTRAEHLRRHQLSHQPAELRCAVRGCDKAFHREDLLRRHEQRHQQEQQLSPPTQSMRTTSSDPSTVYNSTGYSPSLISMSTAYASSQSPRSGSGPAAPDSSWPSHHVSSGAHGHLSTHDQYSLGSTFSGQTAGTTLVPGFDEPRSSATMMGTIPTLHTPSTGAADQRWGTTTSATVSSGAYSTSTDISRLTQLPARSLVDDWVSLPLAASSGDSVSTNGYSAMSFGYETALADNMGLLSHGYHDDASLYGSSRDFANSSSVRSQPPQPTTVAPAPSSETLVTTSASLSTDRLIEPAFQDPSSILGAKAAASAAAVELEVAVAMDGTTDGFGSSGLTQAARMALPTYLDVFWLEIAPKCPIVHRSSLEAAVTIPEHREVLACAMAAVATQYLDDPDDRINGSQLHSYAWSKAKTFTKSDPWPLPIIQTILLCEYYARYRGRKKGSHIASPHFARLYQMMNDPENTYAPIPSEGSLEQRWRIWIDMETRRRVFAACFLLDVHSMRYLEQPPTKVRGMDYTVHETLMIPFTYTTSAMWDAQRAREWGGQANSARAVRTLASISLLNITRDNVALTSIFDGAVLLAALSLKLPRRRSLTTLDLLRSPTDMDPFFLRIASLFPGSGTAYAYMALQHTPLHILLSVSGDSWVFNNKVPSAECFAGHVQKLGEWRVSSSGAVATAFAARALKAFVTRCISLDNAGREAIIRPSWADITDFWGFYVCILICWACGGFGVIEPPPFNLSAALQTVDNIAQLSPDAIHQMVQVHHTRQIIGLGRRLLMKDCLGGRSILMADAVNVLIKLDGGRGEEW